MTDKAKISIGVGVLFILLVLMGFSGIYFVNSVSSNSKSIVKENLVSLAYVDSIEGGLSTLHDCFIQFQSKLHFYCEGDGITLKAVNAIGKDITALSSNITEPKVKMATDSLKSSFVYLNEFVKSFQHEQKEYDLQKADATILNMQMNLGHIYRINRAAISIKSNALSKASIKAVTYLSIIAVVFLIIAIVIILKIRNLSSGFEG